MLNEVNDLANAEANRQANHNQIAQAQESFTEGRHMACHQQTNAELKRQESSCIVQQALPLQNVNHLPWESEAFRN